MHPRLKKIIFNKLYEDLKNVEIIPYKDSIWFIDREKKYWYLQYKKSGFLWWRYKFFTIFFLLFSLKQSEYERVIVDWVEEVLNSKVNSTKMRLMPGQQLVEEVLNSKVNSTNSSNLVLNKRVEDVLNFKVYATNWRIVPYENELEEVLNSRVNITRADSSPFFLEYEVEEILNLTL